MRISDWSSDVCSSDLCASEIRPLPPVNELATKGVPWRRRKSRGLHVFQSEERWPHRLVPPFPGKSVPRRPFRFEDCPCWSRRFRRRSCRSEEHTSELQSLMRISYAVFCLKKKK